ncbi:MAG: pyridoxamine 5'-phosphate oxidase [Acidimicrobiales bacterium]
MSSTGEQGGGGGDRRGDGGDRFAALRARLLVDGLDVADLDADPMAEVAAWIAVATDAGIWEPTAMTLATVDADGAPDARMVLLRGVDGDGLRWYTDRSSAKGRQLAVVPRAAVVLAWPALGRQIRVRGAVTPTDDADSDAYWAGRPHGSRIAASASHQSAELAGRVELDDAIAALEADYPEGTAVPRPERWGGYRLTPERVELWQQRAFRAHDRLRYERDPSTPTGWRIVRLSP